MERNVAGTANVDALVAAMQTKMCAAKGFVHEFLHKLLHLILHLILHGGPIAHASSPYATAQAIGAAPVAVVRRKTTTTTPLAPAQNQPGRSQVGQAQKA